MTSVAGVAVGPSVGSSGTGGGTATAVVSVPSPLGGGALCEVATYAVSVILSVLTTVILTLLSSVYRWCGLATCVSSAWSAFGTSSGGRSGVSAVDWSDGDRSCPGAVGPRSATVR